MATPIAAVSLDLGTTFSGWAFSLYDEYNINPTNVFAKNWQGSSLISDKAPTCILIQPDGKTVKAFGYDAEHQYATLCEEGEQEDWFFFKRFKMKLHREKDIRRDIEIEDVTGKKLPALRIFSLSINYLKDDLLKEINKQYTTGISVQEMTWVLTVPAIWNDAAKQFMREAAIEANIPEDNIRICLEPEAASIYCSHLPVAKCSGTEAKSLSQIKVGKQYIVVDAGGGTVDCIVHIKSRDGCLKETYQATGGPWGGTTVDARFEDFLDNIFGGNVMMSFRRHLEDYIDLLRNFEIKKREVSSTTNMVTLRLPQSLCQLYKEKNGITLKNALSQQVHAYEGNLTAVDDKLRIGIEIFKSFFQPAINEIIQHIESLLNKVGRSNCEAILMVGGFSTSQLLQESIKREFSAQMSIIIPDDAGLVVLKGAVIFGHQPKTVKRRICRRTYGTRTSHKYNRRRCDHKKGKVEWDEEGDLRCYDIFDIHAKIGQSIKLGEVQKEVIYTPMYDDKESFKCVIYASTSEEPQLVTEEGCQKVGEVDIPIRDKTTAKARRYGISFIFGGTEIEIKVTDKATRRVTYGYANFLG